MLWNNSKRPEIPRDGTVREFPHPSHFPIAPGVRQVWPLRWPPPWVWKPKVSIFLGHQFSRENLGKSGFLWEICWHKSSKEPKRPKYQSGFSPKFEWASYKLLFSLFGDFFHFLLRKVNHRETPPFREEVWNFSLDSTTFFFSANPQRRQPVLQLLGGS